MGMQIPCAYKRVVHKIICDKCHELITIECAEVFQSNSPKKGCSLQLHTQEEKEREQQQLRCLFASALTHPLAHINIAQASLSSKPFVPFNLMSTNVTMTVRYLMQCATKCV